MLLAGWAIGAPVARVGGLAADGVAALPRWLSLLLSFDVAGGG